MQLFDKEYWKEELKLYELKILPEENKLKIIRKGERLTTDPSYYNEEIEIKIHYTKSYIYPVFSYDNDKFIELLKNNDIPYHINNNYIGWTSGVPLVKENNVIINKINELKIQPEKDPEFPTDKFGKMPNPIDKFKINNDERESKLNWEDFKLRLKTSGYGKFLSLLKYLLNFFEVKETAYNIILYKGFICVLNTKYGEIRIFKTKHRVNNRWNDNTLSQIGGEWKYINNDGIYSNKGYISFRNFKKILELPNGKQEIFDILELKPIQELKINEIFKEAVPRKNIIKDFIKFALKELNINKGNCVIKLSKDTEKAKNNHSFGLFDPNSEKHVIWVYIKNRNLADILRTIAHELVHFSQKINNKLKPGSGNTGSEIENEANAQAGILLRKYGANNINIYEGLQNELKIQPDYPKLDAYIKYKENNYYILDIPIINDIIKSYWEYFVNTQQISVVRNKKLMGGHIDEYKNNVKNILEKYNIPYKIEEDDYFISFYINIEYINLLDGNEEINELKIQPEFPRLNVKISSHKSYAKLIDLSSPHNNVIWSIVYNQNQIAYIYHDFDLNNSYYQVEELEEILDEKNIEYEVDNYSENSSYNNYTIIINGIYLNIINEKDLNELKILPESNKIKLYPKYKHITDNYFYCYELNHATTILYAPILKVYRVNLIENALQIIDYLEERNIDFKIKPRNINTNREGDLSTYEVWIPEEYVELMPYEGKEQINEVGENLKSAYEYDLITTNLTYWLYYFNIPSGTEYEVAFFKFPGPEKIYERMYKPKQDIISTETNEGYAISINATVMSITIDFLERNSDWNTVKIAPIDNRRKNLVRRYLENNLPSKYILDEIENEFYIFRKTEYE